VLPLLFTPCRSVFPPRSAISYFPERGSRLASLSPFFLRLLVFFDPEIHIILLYTVLFLFNDDPPAMRLPLIAFARFSFFFGGPKSPQSAIYSEAFSISLETLSPFLANFPLPPPPPPLAAIFLIFCCDPSLGVSWTSFWTRFSIQLLLWRSDESYSFLASFAFAVIPMRLSGSLWFLPLFLTFLARY